MNQPVFIGQVLYREIHNRNSKAEIKEYTVSKIGKKYFYLNENDRYPINKESLKYEDKIYSQSSFQLYKEKQEILDRQERGALIDKIRKSFDWLSKQNFTLEQLREVASILNINH